MIEQLPIFVYPQENWSVKECEKICKSRKGPHDEPFRGFLGSSSSIPPRFGKIVYNGGCVHNDMWYAGEERPFPILPDEYEIVVVPSWGWRLKRKDDNKPAGTYK